jgi:uncharacterized protein YfiM (DUF2279 family)
MSALALLFCCTVARAAPAPPDAWFGEDKVKHLTTSFAVTTMGFAGARTISIPRDEALLAAAAGGLLLGIAKELHDRAHGNPFSLRDLVWDVLGTGLAISFAAQMR